MSKVELKGRIYVTHDKTTGDVVFCRASTPAQAINYVTRDRFSIRTARPEDMIGVQKSEILDATLGGGASGSDAAA